MEKEVSCEKTAPKDVDMIDDNFAVEHDFDADDPDLVRERLRRAKGETEEAVARAVSRIRSDRRSVGL